MMERGYRQETINGVNVFCFEMNAGDTAVARPAGSTAPVSYGYYTGEYEDVKKVASVASVSDYDIRIYDPAPRVKTDVFSSARQGFRRVVSSVCAAAGILSFIFIMNII